MKNKMRIKTKRVGRNEFRVNVRTEKGNGDFFVKRCLKCNSVFVTNKDWDLMCSECIKEMDEEVSKAFNEFQQLLAHVTHAPCETERVDRQNKEKCERKTTGDKTEGKETYFANKKSKKFYGAMNYVFNNPPKIRVPKYEEKWAFIKKARPICCVNKNIGLKIMELIARGKTLQQVAKLFNIKESSTWVYYNDLRTAGLIINTSQGWMINPAIEYELL